MPLIRTGFLCFLAVAVAAGCASTGSGSRYSAEQSLREAEAVWRGSPYAPGGSDFTGVDPVSFVRRLYSELFSIDLPRTTSRIAEAGQKVSQNNLIPGDLLLFRLDGGLRHIGIYLGRTEFVHVSIDQGVTVDRVSSAQWRDALVGARRMTLPSLAAKPAQPQPAVTGDRSRTGW